MTETHLNWVVAGVNFRKASLEMRNKFALTEENIREIYENRNDSALKDFFILSTCNRTEIYSTHTRAGDLINLLGSVSNLDSKEVEKYCYIKEGDDAVNHLFRVASGLESQILGDYEIVGQLKKAFSLAKSCNRVNGVIEKLVSMSLQTSKQVKGRTALSDGTTSVAYAVIQLLKEAAKEDKPLNICLYGLGKIGGLTLKNLTHYLPQHKITVVNRNESKAIEAAEKYLVGYAAITNQEEALNNADVLIVATGADKPILFKKDILPTPIKTIFDLSVPSNISEDVKEINGIKMFNVDELSQLVNQTIEQRKNQVPIAEAIILEHFTEFKEWIERRNHYRSLAKMNAAEAA